MSAKRYARDTGVPVPERNAAGTKWHSGWPKMHPTIIELPMEKRGGDITSMRVVWLKDAQGFGGLGVIKELPGGRCTVYFISDTMPTNTLSEMLVQLGLQPELLPPPGAHGTMVQWLEDRKVM